MIQIVRRTELDGSPRVLLTRDESGCRDWAGLLAERGLDSLSLPCLEKSVTRNAALIRRFVDAVAAAGADDWLVFTSPHGVESAAQLLESFDLDALPQELRIAAVGPATASRCQAAFGRCDFQPPTEQARGEVLGRLLAGKKTGRALLAVARGGRRDVDNALRAAGWQVERFDVYETRAVENASPEISYLEVDAVFLASPSAVDGLFRQAAVGDVPLLAIGPTTVRALEDAGRLAAAVAATPSLESLVDLTFQTLEIPAEIAQ